MLTSRILALNRESTLQNIHNYFYYKFFNKNPNKNDAATRIDFMGPILSILYSLDPANPMDPKKAYDKFIKGFCRRFHITFLEFFYMTPEQVEQLCRSNPLVYRKIKDPFFKDNFFKNNPDGLPNNEIIEIDEIDNPNKKKRVIGSFAAEISTNPFNTFYQYFNEPYFIGDCDDHFDNPNSDSGLPEFYSTLINPLHTLSYQDPNSNYVEAFVDFPGPQSLGPNCSTQPYVAASDPFSTFHDPHLDSNNKALTPCPWENTCTDNFTDTEDLDTDTYKTEVPVNYYTKPYLDPNYFSQTYVEGSAHSFDTFYNQSQNLQLISSVSAQTNLYTLGNNHTNFFKSPQQTLSEEEITSIQEDFEALDLNLPVEELRFYCKKHILINKGQQVYPQLTPLAAANELERAYPLLTIKDKRDTTKSYSNPDMLALVDRARWKFAQVEANERLLRSQIKI